MTAAGCLVWMPWTLVGFPALLLLLAPVCLSWRRFTRAGRHLLLLPHFMLRHHLLWLQLLHVVLLFLMLLWLLLFIMVIQLQPVHHVTNQPGLLVRLQGLAVLLCLLQLQLLRQQLQLVQQLLPLQL